MKFSYLEWDEALSRFIRSLEGMNRLFYQLLLRTDGDVDEALKWMRYLQERGHLPADWDLDAFEARLGDEGVVKAGEEGLRLTGKGQRTLRRESLELIFGGLGKSGPGQHATAHTGRGGERLPETRAYRFGDNLSDLDHPGTLRNALRRGIEDIAIAEDDFEVFETEHRTSVATVLLLDVSHSMVLYGEDRMTPAKTTALALAELILTKYPKDSLDVVLFGDDAKRLSLDQLPFAGAGPYHTNTKAGLRLAQQILRRKRHVQKQVFMITDGKPSCIWEEGRLYKNPFGLDEKIVNRTLDEAVLCRRRGIPITTFMVADDPLLVRFVEDLARMNHGRAYFTGLDDLGGAVFRDFIRNRRKRVQ
jgi:Ca-activated chloride channel family protein